MRFAYVDTSCLVAIAFEEPGADEVAARLRRYEQLFSSNFLEAELKATLVRERLVGEGGALLSWVTWVYPNRPLTPEVDRVCAYGYLRGADLWHLACALFLARDPKEIDFLTLDGRQGEVAGQLGFSLL